MTASNTLPVVADYQKFLQSKRVVAKSTGIDVPLDVLHARLFPFQKVIVQWALSRGQAAIFAECGLGKTGMFLSWSDIVHQHTGGDVLLLVPLAVASQTVAEGEKMEIVVHPCRSQADVRPGLNVTNYEMLQHFDASHFVGVVCDESSLLKSFSGATKRALVESFAATPYRLCCTATPSPNDVMELLNHSEFLGIMPSSEALMRWFINDTMHNGHYRLKGHAVKDFWEWVASWAISLRKPSDLGPQFSDSGYVLPELYVRHHYIETDVTVGVEEGQLFRAPTMNATNLHKEMRLTAAARAQAVADLVNGSEETWICWCHTDYEADELKKRIPDAVEVRGSEKLEVKERKLAMFLAREARILIGKPRMFGYGLNLQFCHKAAFVGLSYSMEQFYQAVRRIYRFGQKNPVEIVIVAADTEAPLVASLERKLHEHVQMHEAMTTVGHLSQQQHLTLVEYNPQVPMVLPSWLHTMQESEEMAS